MPDINHLDEGTLLYEESSVKSVSEAIRAITGRNEKYSHTEQADVIWNLKSYIYPFFTLGPGSGGIGTAQGNGWWGTTTNSYLPGPIFPNILYNFRETGKNLHIVFKITPSEIQSSLGVLNAGFKIGGYIIRMYNGDAQTSYVMTVGNTPVPGYDPDLECRIVIDTFNKSLSIYIDDILAIDSLPISDTYFEKNSNSGRDDALDFRLPSYAANPDPSYQDSGWHTCEIKYLRLEMEGY